MKVYPNHQLGSALTSRANLQVISTDSAINDLRLTSIRLWSRTFAPLIHVGCVELLLTCEDAYEHIMQGLLLKFDFVQSIHEVFFPVCFSGLSLCSYTCHV